jgi:hypothetical protein
LVERGAVDLAALVSATYPLAETGPALAAAAGRAGLKVVVAPAS